MYIEINDYHEDFTQNMMIPHSSAFSNRITATTTISQKKIFSFMYMAQLKHQT